MKITHVLCRNWKDDFPVNRPVGNTCLFLDGQRVLSVLVVVAKQLGRRVVIYGNVGIAAIRFRLQQALFFKTATCR